MNTKIDITRFSPCDEGREYYESKASFKEAWNDCEHGDWLLWIAAKLEIDRKLLVKAAALCANTVRHLMEDKRSTDAIDACLRYAAGEIDDDEMENYASAADAAACYATSSFYYASARAASDAARTARTARTAASSAADAVYCSIYDRSDIDAYYDNRLLTANICREQLTQAVMEKVSKLTQE